MSIALVLARWFPCWCPAGRALLGSCLHAGEARSEKKRDVVRVETAAGIRVLTVPGSWTMERVLTELVRCRGPAIYRLFSPAQDLVRVDTLRLRIREAAVQGRIIVAKRED
jgi:hypothetical protein